MWFEKMMGFGEESPAQVRENITLDGGTLKSLVNGRVFTWGGLETPSLAELRERGRASGRASGKSTLREVVADIQQLHADTANAGALFQVASQFNLLEMTGPSVTPERGVGIYEYDRTQGPACAIACGAGTIYRNYFVPVNGRAGQSEDNQLDCLADLGAAFGNEGNRLWEMRNGYALPSRGGLDEIARRLRASGKREIDELRGLLRIGVQWDTQVTIAGSGHTVTQAYCSALPVAYSGLPRELWGEFARLVLEAAYEATVCAATLNAEKTGNNKLYLTLLGGGAFGNDLDWIIGALRRALDLYRLSDLDVAVVSYGSSSRHVRELVDQIQ